MRLLLFSILCLFSVLCCGQSLPQQLQAALNKLQLDSQFRHAITAITVVDLSTDKIVFEKNSQWALAPASTQKIITSIAAFDMLGPTYRYETILGYDGLLKDSVLTGNLNILGSGDPTLGSGKWKETEEKNVIRKIIQAIQKAGIKKIKGKLVCGNSAFSAQAIPGGWVWEDIGSYYGAGAYALNWRENSYDVQLSSGKGVEEKVTIIGLGKGNYFNTFFNEVIADKKGTGDNAYIYQSIDPASSLVIKGTIPVEEKLFTISGSYPNPSNAFSAYVYDELINAGIVVELPKDQWLLGSASNALTAENVKKEILLTNFLSPSFDSMNYYFLHKSINLYGEAFVKSICLAKSGTAETQKGVQIVKDFWAQRGIEKTALAIIDGSGLSPQNRVTTNALVQALQYAKKQPWFMAFYNGLPEYNGMKLKSGSIGGVKAYAGYHKAASGKDYAISIITNGYNGSGSAVSKKLFVVLDVLK